jgi:hypothetical protein
MRTITIPFVFIATTLFAHATESEFNRLYDYYFPKHGQGAASSVYRRNFDETLFGPPPPKFAYVRERQLYYAFRGDPTAFRAFVRNADRDINGAQGEEWDYECLLLLLRLGDSRFSELLRSEEKATREAVGIGLEPFINWQKHHFPKTRALYSYRYARPQAGLYWTNCRCAVQLLR